jgi:hypothetical protein
VCLAQPVIGVTPPFVKNCTLRGKSDWERLPGLGPPASTPPRMAQKAQLYRYPKPVAIGPVSADKFQIARGEAVALLQLPEAGRQRQQLRSLCRREKLATRTRPWVQDAILPSNPSLAYNFLQMEE